MFQKNKNKKQKQKIVLYVSSDWMKIDLNFIY